MCLIENYVGVIITAERDYSTSLLISSVASPQTLE